MTMKTQVGKICMEAVSQQILPHSNKTKKYLLPCLTEYGEEFTNKLNGVFKVAVGIGDMIISNRGIKHEKHMFILLDTSIARNFFIPFLDWIRDQEMYEDDYVYGNILISKLHMVIVKLPEKYYDTFETFKLGAYSKMYKKEDIDKLFKNKRSYRKVLIKDHNYKIEFIGELNRTFDLTGIHQILPEEYDGEYDLPPDKEEIFNNHIKKRDYESE